MAVIKAQCILPCETGEPADAASNTWYFNTADTGSGAQTAVLAGLAAFYTDYQLADWVDVGADMTVKLYDAEAPMPNYPLSETAVDITWDTSSNRGPTQLTCALSFFNTTDTSVPRARRRGRIYLPWPRINMLAGGYITTTWRDMVWSAVDSMDAALSTDGVHVIWSATREDFSFIDEYRIDNVADIIRRRQQEPTAKWTHTL